MNSYQKAFLKKHKLTLHPNPEKLIRQQLKEYVPSLTHSFSVFTPFKNKVLEAMKGKKLEPDNPRAIKSLLQMINPNGSSDISSYIRAYGLSFVDSVILAREARSSYLMEQLLWRIFYYQADINDESLQRHKWIVNHELQKKFFEAKTGFPVIDASLRCLKATGKLSNKLRMTVASFFCKNMLQPWMDGEKFFAKYLEDYDEVLNRGNWIWCSQLRYDNQPFVRFLKPSIQLKKLLKTKEGSEWYKTWTKEGTKEGTKDTKEIIDWDKSCERFRKWKRNV